MEDFDEWNKIKKRTQTKHKRANIKEGEIWYVKLGKNIGFEEDGKGPIFQRPVIILKKFNNTSFHAIPLSTTTKEGRYYFKFQFKKEKTSTALVSQGKYLDTKRLIGKIGDISKNELKKLKKTIIELIYDGKIYCPTITNFSKVGAVPKGICNPSIPSNNNKNQEVTTNELTFEPFIKEEEILRMVNKLAQKIHEDHKNDNPIFIGVLNGVVHFISELTLRFPSPCEVEFIKLSSYHGTDTTGLVKVHLDITRNIKDRTVIIVEDIIDTGLTLDAIFDLRSLKAAKEIKVCTLFLKPDKYHKKHKIDYIGKEIPSEFIHGHGFDVDGQGRNLRDIYKLKAK
jgi:hypoxanthine phosphoribosyltransferase